MMIAWAFTFLLQANKTSCLDTRYPAGFFLSFFYAANS